MEEKRAPFGGRVLPPWGAPHRFPRWVARPPADADDVGQEAILGAFRGFDALRGSNVKAWLLAIVRNCPSTALKQQQRRGFVPLPEEHDARDGHAMIASTPDPESVSIHRDDERTLERLMWAL